MKKLEKDFDICKGIILATLFIISLLGLSFLYTAFLVKIICWAFGWQWSWKISLGIWGMIIIIREIFRREKKNGN